MTEHKSVERLEEELAQLRETEESLLEEGAGLEEKLSEALETERASWVEAAVAGGTAQTTKTAGVTERGLGLARQLWATRVRALEVSMELKDGRIKGYEARRKEASEEAAAIRKRQAELQEELLRKSNVVEEARRRARDLKHSLRDEEAQLARLRKAGPDHATFGRGR